VSVRNIVSLFPFRQRSPDTAGKETRPEHEFVCSDVYMHFGFSVTDVKALGIENPFEIDVRL
jgi:hypothetical protein